jgi:anti-sigma28 factor (negative regulator of flagellin synthesis)
MKVDNRNSSGVAGLRIASGAAPRASNGSAPAGNDAFRDHVDISIASNYFSAVRTSAEALEAHYASRVAALTNAVAAGTYEVSAPALSDRIVQEHLRAA